MLVGHSRLALNRHIAVVLRSVTTPRHGRGHGPKATVVANHRANAMNVQKRDANLSLERRLTSGVLTKMVKIFKGCTIQSTISDSAHSDSYEQVDKINDPGEQVDARNWLRNDSAEQVDQINDSSKQVYEITNDSDKQVDAIIDF